MIVPLSIATRGYITRSPLSVSSRGYLATDIFGRVVLGVGQLISNTTEIFGFGIYKQLTLEIKRVFTVSINTMQFFTNKIVSKVKFKVNK